MIFFKAYALILLCMIRIVTSLEQLSIAELSGESARPNKVVPEGWAVTVTITAQPSGTTLRPKQVYETGHKNVCYRTSKFGRIFRKKVY